MSGTKKLTHYRERREFKETPEPSGTIKRSSSKKPIFVIQKHAARSLHYDVRLEIEGVLKSWAVPKGPSTNPRVKRLAVPTEDHPMEYAHFEGVIPEGHYGAGPVIIWDKGTFKNLKKDKDGNSVPLEQCYKDGHVEVFLAGKKLRGAYAFVKTHLHDNWLLVKMKDEYADARRNPVSTQQESVVSGKTIKQLAHEYKKKGAQ